MNPSQKFEELSSALRVGCLWLDEIEDQDDPFIKAIWELLNAFHQMIEGDRDWKECFEVIENIENKYPEVRS